MIVIVDYKTGNLGSIANAFKRVGVTARIAETPDGLEGATGLVLPGIGHFDNCARNLRKTGFADALREPVLDRRIPILGICVGAQLLTRGSEEGVEPGLGWIEADTLGFRGVLSQEYKVPHMGWNLVRPEQAHGLFAEFDDCARFYFVHSYYMRCDKAENVLSTTDYGAVFDSAIVKSNIIGVQFHPEKSHRYGLRLFKNFAKIAESMSI